MNHSLINSAVTMRALQRKLDVLANNIANVDAVGFKRKEASFEDILTNRIQQPAEFYQEGRLSPLGFNQGWGARLSQVQIDLSQGPLNSTEVITDLAIEGDALFEIARSSRDEEGNTIVQTAYTRDGSFELAVRPGDLEHVVLSTKDGYNVRGVDGGAIRVPVGYHMNVDADGRVTAFHDSQPEEHIYIGQIKLVRAVRPQYLQHIGQNLYVVPATLENNIGQVIQDALNSSELQEKVAVRQGYLEQSNVSLGDEMTDVMNIQRAFQLSSRAASSADEMMGMANNLRS